MNNPLPQTQLKRGDDGTLDAACDAYPSVFLLTGIPGHEDVHLWISIPFSIIYAISIYAAIIFFIKTDPSLHEPMYIFLSMLSTNDFGVLIATVPTILGVFLLNSREISLHACLAQLFFIHSLSFIESSVLLSMAFDRFIAICNPVRYASILSPPRIAKMGLVFAVRGVVVAFPLSLFLKWYQYCRASVLSHCYCINSDVMKLACSDIRVRTRQLLAGTGPEHMIPVEIGGLVKS
ncbi:olfactory receptor 51G2-like [Pelodiscus sinensis]|uniref:olfactory receptor 51G2-like n=1 Tax=Pelodiscus sinensis TaxID=13735 RepID=UPI003F6AAA25